MVLALKTVGVLFILMAVAIFRANRLRPANRYFSLMSLASGAWSFNYGFIVEGGAHLSFHLRLGAGLASFLPLMMSVVSSAICHPGQRAIEMRPRLVWWLAAGVVLGSITAIPSFVTRGADGRVSFSELWIAQHLMLAAAMFYTGYEAARRLSTLAGPRRTELLVTVVFTSCAIGMISALLAWFGPSTIIVAIVTACATWIVWSLLVEKIYDARRAVHVLVRTISIVVVSSGLFILTERWLSADADAGSFFPKFAASIVATTCGFYIAQYFFGRSIARLNKDIAGFQSQLSRISRTCNDYIQAVAETEQLLTAYSANAYTWILNEVSAGVFQGAGMQIEEKHFNWQRVNETRWITPETISQVRAAGDAPRVREWLRENGASLVMLTARSEQHVNCAIIFGERRHAVTYTYYELERLAMMADSVAAALTAVRASSQAQRAGQMMALGLVSASVLHEIKQPVAALRLFFKMLPTHFSDQRFRDDYFPLLPRELDRIQSTLSDYLKFSRLEQFRLEVFCPEAVLLDVIRLVSPKARQYGVTLPAAMEKHHSIYADKNVLKQAALNFLLNALEAVAQNHGTQREVEVTTWRDADRWTFSVRDTGPGLSTDLLNNLFRPFMSTKEDGCGLGLYISRDQIVKVGGRISAGNRPEGGAEFRVDFPLATADHVKLEPVTSRPALEIEGMESRG